MLCLIEFVVAILLSHRRGDLCRPVLSLVGQELRLTPGSGKVNSSAHLAPSIFILEAIKQPPVLPTTSSLQHSTHIDIDRDRFLDYLH